MFLNCEELDFAESHYYKINWLLFSTIKLWPYQQSKFAKINGIFLFAILLSFVFFQFTTFVTFKYTMDFFIMVLSHAIPSLLCLIQYYLFYTNSDKVKQIWKNIHDGWTNLKDETERKIMQRYSYSGELSTIRLTLGTIMGITIYEFIQISPIILDIIFPLNETHRKFHALAEYFIDEKIYYYPILCHRLISLFLDGFIVAATTTFQIVYIQYICGLLKIACCRIEHSIDKYVPPDLQIDHMLVQRISTAVQIHREALKCADFMATDFLSASVFMIILGVASLSLNLLRLFRAIVFLRNINELILSIMLVSLHFIIMFIDNYYAQKITDHNSEIFDNAYNARWYMAPIKIQKLLLFIMKKTTRTYTINVYHVFLASVEGFAKLSSLSISYFMVIYSVMK